MKLIILVIAGLLGAFAFVLSRQWMESVQLSAAIELAALEQRELGALQAQRQRLAAAQLSGPELRQLRADRTAVSRLRGEMENLKARTAARLAPPPEAPAEPSEVLPPPTVTEGPVSEQFLRNVGRATPAAALETALWAATGGDVDTLQDALLLDGDARTKAEQILAGLPEAIRGQYRTPEHLVAALSLRDIPLDGIQIMPPRKNDPAGTRILARIPARDNKPRTVAVTLRQQGAEWKLVVPVAAVENYGRMLAANAPGRK